MTGETTSIELNGDQQRNSTRDARESEADGLAKRPLRRVARVGAALLLAFPLTLACGARTQEHHGGESHFLQSCGNSDCGSGFECVDAVCTQTCESNATCRGLNDSARCVERRGSSVCDVECEGDGTCAALGEEFACVDGACRVAASFTHASPDDASSGHDVTVDASAPDAAPSSTTAPAPIATDEPPVTEPDAATPTSSSGAGDPTSSGANSTEISGCRYAFVEYEEGERVPSGSCETCVCRTNSIDCEPDPDASCVEYGLPVAPCPEQDVVSDPIDVQFAYIDGDSVFIDATHSTGCAWHNYAVCYDYFMESYPVQNNLRLIHDAHGNDCEALASVQLQFDLRPLATAYDSDNGVIVTPFGTYAYGPLVCEERALAASAQLDNVLSQLDLTCSTDEECELAPVRTDCFEACDTAVSLRETHFADDAAMSSKDLLERELARIDASCSTFESDCGEPESGVACSVLDACPLACDPGNTARCIDSVCQLVEE